MVTGSVFGILYLVLCVALIALVVWALILSIIFLRLRIAELRKNGDQPNAP